MKKQTGMTFIEVLVALVILTTGILGAVAMQASAKKGSFDAMQRSIASAYAQDIIEKIRGNRADILILSGYTGTFGNGSQSLPNPRCNSVASLCTSTQMIAHDLYEWEQRLDGADVTLSGINAGGLVDARGCIQHNDNAVTVVISWQGRVSTQDSADEDFGLENDCGSKTDKRRQLLVNAFIY